MKTVEATEQARGTIKSIVERRIRTLITHQQHNEQIDAILESYAKEHAIEFELFLMEKDNDINMNRVSIEHAYTEWTNPQKAER